MSVKDASFDRLIESLQQAIACNNGKHADARTDARILELPHEDKQISTERLLLRRYRPDDLPDFYEMVSNPAVVRFEPYDPLSMQEAARELDLRGESDEFTAVALKDSGKVIGNIYLSKREYGEIEIGFLFNEGYWSKGYAAESCMAVIAQVFSGGVNRIIAQCDPENAPSWRLLERLGFVREGHLRRNVYFRTDENGRPLWKDTYLYAIAANSRRPSPTSPSGEYSSPMPPS
jgi:ribosomal-protein-alanine N-acetyltransferase